MKNKYIFRSQIYVSLNNLVNTFHTINSAEPTFVVYYRGHNDKISKIVGGHGHALFGLKKADIALFSKGRLLAIWLI